MDKLIENTEILVKEMDLINHGELNKQINDVKDEYGEKLDVMGKSIEVVEQLSSAKEISIKNIENKIINIQSQLGRLNDNTTPGYETEPIVTNEYVLQFNEFGEHYTNRNEMEVNSIYQGVSNHENVVADKTIDQRTELIMFLDSNAKYLDYRKLWTTKGTLFKRCGNLNEIDNIINGNVNYRNLKYILINVGVNNIDENSGATVFNRIRETIDNIQEKYSVKIILGELTPRKDEKDDDVMICNRLINEFAGDKPDIFVAYHSNLRDDNGSFLYDNKHIKKNCIARFAANLKIALRKAYNIQASKNYKLQNLAGYTNNRPVYTGNSYPQQNNVYNDHNNNGDVNNDSNRNHGYDYLKNDLKRKLLAIFD